jgi:hypothetical protein
VDELEQAHIEEKASVHKTLSGKPEANKILGISSRRKEDNNKMNRKETGCENVA